MKIELIKEYCACFRDENGSINTETFKRGDTVSTSMEADRYFTEELAQWLIKNGFAKEVEGSGAWKPKHKEKYYFVDGSGKVDAEPWLNDELDEYRYSVGECFKTEKAAEAWRGYRIARATVSRDEGVMTPEEVIHAADAGIIVGRIIVRDRARNLEASICNFSSAYPCVGTIYFDTCEHARASLDNHPDEWKIISNYDWSRE